MKICMMTNTYLPHVGGVARSVSPFAEEYGKLGHRVLVVAPEKNLGHLALEFYEKIRKSQRRARRETEHSLWGTLGQRLAMEWGLFSQMTQSLATALGLEPEAKAS